MPEVRDFPPEISLQIFPHMRLKGLISARGVSKRWRELISLADIHPARVGLLKLYQKTVHDPLFLRTRLWTLGNLYPFDRQAYIDALLAQHNYIPDDFRFWILEWPARAAIACAWPGLPAVYVHQGTDDVESISGCNFLGRIPPVLHRITLDLTVISPPDISEDGEGIMEACDRAEGSWVVEEDSDPEEYYRTHEKFNYTPPPWEGFPVEVTFPALLVWEENPETIQTFIALAPTATPFSVFVLKDAYYSAGDSVQYTSWISWLEAQLRMIHRAARGGRGPVGLPDGIPSDGEMVPEAVDFEAQPSSAQLWTVDDEAQFFNGMA
ncbi:hypothetical protein C8R46DRAFT_1297191 [Mycena filopes]|nr:hypothetical protein C8R46DRAFT_1297191 [Mycena filopes]